MPIPRFFLNPPLWILAVGITFGLTMIAACEQPALSPPASARAATPASETNEEADARPAVTSDSTASAASADSPSKFRYPTPRRGDQVDDYHGRQVADPFRWLEDTDSAETSAWIEAENLLTFDFLKAIPARPADPSPFGKALELRQVRHPHGPRRALFLQPQRWTAKPKRDLRRDRARCRAARPLGSQHAFGRRHRRAFRHCDQRRRSLFRLRPGDRRIGLARAGASAM